MWFWKINKIYVQQKPLVTPYADRTTPSDLSVRDLLQWLADFAFSESAP